MCDPHREQATFPLTNLHTSGIREGNKELVLSSRTRSRRSPSFCHLWTNIGSARASGSLKGQESASAYAIGGGNRKTNPNKPIEPEYRPFSYLRQNGQNKSIGIIAYVLKHLELKRSRSLQTLNGSGFLTNRPANELGLK